MPCAAPEILDCLIRYKSRQLLSLVARTTILHLQIQHHARELAWQAHRQAAGGGIVATWGVTQEFQILAQLLRDLDRADAALRTCEGERRYLASLLRDWGDA